MADFPQQVETETGAYYMSFRAWFAQAHEIQIHIESAESAEKERVMAVAAPPGFGVKSLFTPETAKLAKNTQ